MNKLMTVAFASLACVAMAQAPEGVDNGSRRESMRDRGRMMERMSRMRSDDGAEGAVKAVLNPRVAEAIGLSDEVQLKIKQLNLDSRKDIREDQKKMREAMDKQAKLMTAEKIDEAAVMATIDELFEIRKSVAKAQTKLVIAIRALLTPEQIKQASESMRKFREERRAKRVSGRSAVSPSSPAVGK